MAKIVDHIRLLSTLKDGDRRNGIIVNNDDHVHNFLLADFACLPREVKSHLSSLTLSAKLPETPICLDVGSVQLQR